MVARLVLDALCRNRWIYLVGSAILIPCWLLFGVSRPSPLPISMTAMSLILTSVIGPVFAVATIGIRELRHLPVSNRDLWGATWVVATIVPALILLGTKAISGLLVVASGGSPKVSADAMLLSAVYDFTFAALLLPLLVPLRYGGRAGRRGGRTQVHRAAANAGAATRRRLADRLTGIPRVVIPHVLATIALPVVACLALASYGVIFGSGPWSFVPQTPSVFDPEDVGDRGLTLFVLLPCGVATMVGLWNPWARLLKVLPLSARQINTLLLLTPFATWTILWLLGWSAYVFAYGTPQTLRLEFAFGMTAIGALAHAVFLRFQGSAASFWILAFIGGLMPQLVKAGLRDETVPRIVFAIIGAIAFGMAAFVNHRTLTHSTSSSLPYGRPRPLGSATPGVR